MVPSAPVELADLPEAGFKRVGEWRFVDLESPMTTVELQLKRHFERVFAKSQFSPEYTCLAREDGNFYEQYAARPEEYLGEQMAGRCRAPTASDWHNRTYFSDGTILDSPLSEATLTDITDRFAPLLRPFTVFGVSARYNGPNMVVTIETAAPEATIQISEPDADCNVRVSGEVFGEFVRVNAVINQGEAGSAFCKQDDDVDLPKYAFTCSMAPDDDEAWISLSGSDAQHWEVPLVELPAHRAGWIPPKEYHRVRKPLPAQVDTRTALVTAINDLRRKIGRKPLLDAAAQSAFMQTIYQQAFKLNSAGDWTGDTQQRKQMLRGDRVSGVVSWGNVASGIAFDGDAADWLAYRLLFPINRITLMAPDAEAIAIAMQGDPAVGFGAAAVVYQLLSPEREAALGEALATSITKARKGQRTRRLENPEELDATARQVAGGSQPPSALSSTLARLNLLAKGPRYMAGFFVPLDGSPLPSSIALLLDAKELAYGIVVTHMTDPSSGWSRAMAFVWFLTDRPRELQAVRGTSPSTHT
jgi:hypothetical protein